MHPCWQESSLARRGGRARRSRIGLRAAAVLLSVGLIGAAEARANVRVHGVAGSFGSVLERVRAAATFTTQDLPDDAFPPGKSAFFTTATSDGTVFAAGFHQNTQNLVPTGCHVNVVCMNPEAPTCHDASDGQAKHFANILVKTRDGSTTVPRDAVGCAEPATSFAFRAFGVDISDIETIRDAQGEERVVFVSSLASLGNYPEGDFPMVGFLSKIDGAWRLDEQRQYWREDVTRSSPEAEVACPSGDCGGFSEIAFLEKSRRLAIGVYFPLRQGLVVMDLDGVILAHYRIPRPGNRCTADPTDTIPWLGVRQVDVDPTAPLGDERIAITVDGFDPFAHPIQELRYDDATRTLTPVTNMVTTVSGSEPLPDCTPQGQNANYDKLGNLVVGAFSEGRSTYHVYVKDPTSGRRSIETACPFTGFTEQDVARTCMADLSVGEITAFDKQLGVRWGFSHHNANTLSAAGSSTLARVNFDGTVGLLDLLQSANGAPAYVSYQRLDLEVGRLARGDRVKGLVVWKGALREGAQDLWVPVATTLEPVVPDCASGLFCEVYVNERRPSWLYQIDTRSLLDDRLRARSVDVSHRELDRASKEHVRFVVRTNRNASVYRQRSGLWLYPADSALPILRERVQRGVCTDGACEYKAQFRQRRLRNVAPGRYRWSMAVSSKGSTDVLHAQGVIDVR